MDLSSLKTDTKLADEGAWVDLDPTTRIKVARYGNRNFRDRLRALMKPYNRMIENGTMDDTKADELLVQAISETVVLDWEGLEMNGEPVTYSAAKAKELLLDPALRDFRELVISLSNELEVFRGEEIEETVGKSQPTSDGVSSGEST